MFPQDPHALGSQGSPPSTPDNAVLGEEIDADVVPPYCPPGQRTLVLCFDGTGDQFDTDNSNVIMLFSMLMKDRPSEQLVYYQAGIGTYTIPEIATPTYASLSKTLDEMIAWDMNAHVMGGYEFLMSNYHSGDKICLFGFSRGAYTARALAGMVHKVGLLPKGNHQQVPFAYHMFGRTDETGWKQSKAFKKCFSMDVDIDFIGVWDTVCSIGLIPRTLPFTSSNSAIRVFRHALSLDEHRAKFKANHYQWPTQEEHAKGVQHGEMPKSGPKKGLILNLRKDTQRPDQLEHERHYTARDEDQTRTDVLEVWFAGCHCDVGGGSVPNDSKHNLARIPLRWMIRECFKMNTGIRFHAEGLRSIGLDPASLWPHVQPRPPAIYSMPSLTADHARASTADTLVNGDEHPLTEEENDYIDALSPIYDQLQLAKYWWVLEVIPLEHRHKRMDGTWEDRLTINMGRGRVVPTDRPFRVHRSVKLRQDKQNYKPNAIFDEKKLDIEWVD
ncbi:hypothetical protein WOLCODRAFT_61605 [Wolfiporia cocos MD-104 SS10]|uniref:T6SS Phospholipase effector Tle1-like catalytic domain-containing protein n=1 Tax=Wolfiporia cocos (strain MD-104) TaxID=742152 RepID=A0A2H3IXY3_WOLCO|nr:hypothetical protein WOLCODRAFT_61605 [Wolfiporia cocos MD-104 SS10]